MQKPKNLLQWLNIWVVAGKEINIRYPLRRSTLEVAKHLAKWSSVTMWEADQMPTQPFDLY